MEWSFRYGGKMVSWWKGAAWGLLLLPIVAVLPARSAQTASVPGKLVYIEPGSAYYNNPLCCNPFSRNLTEANTLLCRKNSLM